MLFVRRPLATMNRSTEGIREKPTNAAMSLVLNPEPSSLWRLSKNSFIRFLERSRQSIITRIRFTFTRVIISILLGKSDLFSIPLKYIIERVIVRVRRSAADITQTAFWLPFLVFIPSSPGRPGDDAIEDPISTWPSPGGRLLMSQPKGYQAQGMG